MNQDNTINIEVSEFAGSLEDFERKALEFFGPQRDFRGSQQLIELAKTHLRSGNDLYQVTYNGSLAGLAAVHFENKIITFNVFVVDEGFRAVGVGDALFESIVANQKYSGVEVFESYALPGDRHTKNFFESRNGKARLLVVTGPVGKSVEH